MIFLLLNRFIFSKRIDQERGVRYIGTLPAETDENSWVFYQGKWKRVWRNRDERFEKYKDKYSLVAIELTLTN